MKQQNPQPRQNPQLTKRPVKQRPPMTKLLLLHNKKLHNVCYLTQVRFLTFMNLLSLFFQYSPVNTARKYTEANSLFWTMSQKGQKVFKLHVPKNMYPTLLQTEILQEPLNVNLMVAMAHSLLLTPEEFITTIFTNNCSLESTKPRTWTFQQEKWSCTQI